MITQIIWDISPEIVEGFVFRWYGLFWVLGMLIGLRIMVNIYKSEGIPTIEVDKLVIYLMLGAVTGARLGHILFYDPVYYFNNPVEILPIKLNPTFQFTGFAGLASHGGFIGALIALYLYNRKHKRDYMWLLDRLVIAGAALGGFIRLGNLMNSEMIGTPTNVPWAFVFTLEDQVPRHPSQLYEGILYLIISVVLYFVWKSKKFNEARGFIFGLGIMLIFISRFLIEFLKEDQVAFEGSMILNMGQLLSIPLIVGSIAIMIWSYIPLYHDHPILP